MVNLSSSNATMKSRRLIIWPPPEYRPFLFIVTMDFLDPRKQRAHTIRLTVGYVLIGVAILFATIILLYTAYGFGFGKNGQIIQNGLVFLSSQPGPANIYLNGKLNKSQTNTRLQLPAGQYGVELQRDGYRPWQRQISVEGGSVAHYDYPFLFPVKLLPTDVQTLAAAPAVATQSPDRHWLLLSQPDSLKNFSLYDLSDPKKVAGSVITLSLPASILSDTGSATDQTWHFSEWSTDNQHVLLQHIYPSGSEYIMLDILDPAQTINLTRTLKLDGGLQLSLYNQKYDQYYVFDTAAKTLARTDLKVPDMSTLQLDHILAFKAYGSNKLLYATDQGQAAGKVSLSLQDGDTTYKMRETAAQPPYLMDMASYNGDWYVAIGASGENKVYVYKDPQSQRPSLPSPDQPLVPIRTLKVIAPNYLAFSANTRFIVAENGTQFTDYDAETDKSYSFTLTAPLDAPQTHAIWMDGHRLVYISGGKVKAFDYDSLNQQDLLAANPSYLPFFDRNYKTLYTLAPGIAKPAQPALTGASLLIPQDQ